MSIVIQKLYYDIDLQIYRDIGKQINKMRNISITALIILIYFERTK